MPRSFKLRMALFSLCTSGAILLAFAVLFLSTARRAELEHFDRNLRTLSEKQASKPLGKENWSAFEKSLTDVFGDHASQRVLFKVLSTDGSSIYESPAWPAELDVQQFLPAELIDRFEADGPEAFDDPAPPPPKPLPEENFWLPDEPASEHDFGPSPGPNKRRHEPPPRILSPLFHTHSLHGEAWRFLFLRNHNKILILGGSLTELHAEFRRLEIACAFSVCLGLLVLATLSWWIANRALGPIRGLTNVAQTITAQDMSLRVPSQHADREFLALIEVINGMLTRLEVSFKQAARFSADAAHELKTPLTILQGQLNQALQSAKPDSDEQRTYAELLEEVQRLKAIVRKLLLLAQSDSGQMRLGVEPISLNREIDMLLEDLPLLAPDLRLTSDLAPNLVVTADPDLLRQALQNLFSNAVKYNREGGSIFCKLSRENGTAVLEVTNTIPPDLIIDVQRIFDRFYRGDTAHNRKVDGTGLGLSLAREICRAHGGDLTADNPDSGCITFHLRIPAP